MDAQGFRRAQDKALRPLMQRVRSVLHTLGVPVTKPQINEVSMLLWRPTTQARNLTYASTVAYLYSQNLPNNTTIPLPRAYPFEAMQTSIERITSDIRVGGEPVTEANRADTHVIEDTRKTVQGVVSRQAQEPARETVATFGEETEGVGWARMLTGPTSCSFCAMLASRGPVYTSKEAALGRGGNPLNAYHTAYLNKNGRLVGGNCDCIAVPVVDYHTWEGREAFENLEDLWSEAAVGSTDEARNSFRREWDKQVRAGETGQYLPDSIK